MRYFVHCAYNGFGYKGWQRQPGVSTLQEGFERALSDVLRQPITCIGCGRTDAMVHAAQYFFHFDWYEPLPSDLVFMLNKNLPDDMAIFQLFPVEGYPHAQFSASMRSYTYYMHGSKNPYLSQFSSLYPLKNLNMERMKNAMRLVLHHTNYTNFCRSPKKQSSCCCQITRALLHTTPNHDMLRFQISSQRFLQGMVRLIVQRVLDVGMGELPIEEFEAYLNGAATPRKQRAAYPQGLHLAAVEYPFLFVPPIPHFFDGKYIWIEPCE